MHGSTIDVRTWGMTSEKHKYVFPYGSSAHRETFSDMSDEDRARFSGATYAASQWNVHGITSITASGHCKITIATPADLSSHVSWTPTGDTFDVGGTTFYCYAGFYSSAMASASTPMTIPHDDTWSTIVFNSGGSITVDAPAPPCTVIDKVTTLRNVTVNNPAIHILSDGSYLASQTASVSKGYVYKSTDRGSTWTRISNGIKQSYCAVYEHAGTLYMLGCDAVGGGLAVQTSVDGGYTWSENTVLFSKDGTTDGYHGGSSPFVEKDGRVYKAMGERGGATYNAAGDRVWGIVLLSASLSSDLANPSSWTMSNVLYYNRSWLSASSTRWEEPALIKKADGTLAIIARIDGTTGREYAALINVNSDTNISFNRIFSMPGAGKRMTIAYDAASNLYWTLVSPYYSNTSSLYGLNPNQARNSLVLMSSSDLITWTRERTCIYSDNAFNNSYHYIDWRFDGDDLVSVFRLSMDEERGLPLHYHDSNAFGYFRVRNFRSGSAESTVFVDTPVVEGSPLVPSLTY